MAWRAVSLVVLAALGCSSTTTQPAPQPAAAPPVPVVAVLVQEAVAPMEKAEIGELVERPDPEMAPEPVPELALEETEDPASTQARGVETNLLEGWAASMYRRHVARALRHGWRCPATSHGRVCSPSGTVTVQGFTIESVTMQPCGVGEIDAAARRFAASKVGEDLPPPPYDHPDLLGSSVELTLPCDSRQPTP